MDKCYHPHFCLRRVKHTQKKGQVLLEIDHKEYAMSLLAQKSDFISLITGILPDLKFDNPDSYPIWRTYVAKSDVQKPLANLPQAASEQEMFYLSGKGILSRYYTIRSGEEKLKKYIIYAPFDGVVTAANVEAGTAVRMGTALGEFINTRAYELEITVPVAMKHLLGVGKEAEMTSADIPGAWTGKVVRIGGNIDEMTQSIKVFIRTSGATLSEGMYLTANMNQQPFENAMSIPRKMVDDQGRVFVVEDGVLRLQYIKVLSRQGDEAVVSGLYGRRARFC